MGLSEAARAFLDEPRFATLATINLDGTPQLTVMWFQRRDDHIMMNTARGRLKDRNLLRDPRIAICIEDGYRFVTIKGAATLVEDQATAQADIRALAIRYHGEARAEQMVRDQFGLEERITIVLPINDALARGFDD